MLDPPRSEKHWLVLLKGGAMRRDEGKGRGPRDAVSQWKLR